MRTEQKSNQYILHSSDLNSLQICYGLNYVFLPNAYTEALTASTLECDCVLERGP